MLQDHDESDLRAEAADAADQTDLPAGFYEDLDPAEVDQVTGDQKTDDRIDL